MREFTPIESLERTLATWWLVALTTVIGGMVGWLFHQAVPPVYETKFGITVNVDYTQTGPISEADLDHLQWSAGGLIFSIPVREEVVRQAQAQGIQTDLQSLEDIATLERKQAVWEVHIRHRDPQTAAALASLWAKAAITALRQAHQHALQAQALQGYLERLGDCLPAPDGSPPTDENCTVRSSAELLSELETASRQAEAHAAASRGINPAMSFELTNTPTIPTEPVLYARNLLVLSGALIGFLLGIWIAGAPVTSQWSERLRGRRPAG